MSEGVTADGWRTLSYPPWAPYALGGAALLLLLGGAAVIRRGRKREAVSVASEANPSPAAAESAAEALPIAAPDMLEEDSIPSLDPEPCEEQGEEKGEEEETPSDAEVSDAAEDMPDETADTDLTSLEEIEELMGLLTEEQLAALWKFAMEESGYGDRLKALLAKSRSAAASRGEGEPAAVTDAEEGEEDLMKFLSGEQLAALWKLALEESGYSDRIKSILAKQRAASQGEGESSQESEDQREGGLLAGEELADLWKSAMEESGYGDTLVAMLEKSKSKSAAKAEADATPSTQKEGAAEDLDDEQLSSLWDAALEESSGGGDGESAEGSEAPEKREEHPAPAERISQEELRALYDRAASQVSGGKPSSRGGSGV
ncbi:hypothetical protein JXA47_05400 [Candidatus Sumerlaeota bacterium]|nr:hypothetical protein [Candidatus Sumerlaeota bacterium]